MNLNTWPIFVEPTGSQKTRMVNFSVKEALAEISDEWTDLILDRGTISAIFNELSKRGSMYLDNTIFA